MKKFLLLSAFTALMAVSAYSQDTYSLKVEPLSLSLSIGESAKINAQVLDGNGNVLPDKAINFYGRGGAIKVDSLGNVTGIKHGDYRVIVLTQGPDGNRVRQDVNVSVAPAPISEVRINEIPAEIYEGVHMELQITVVDEAGFERDEVPLSFESSAPEVAYVDQFSTLYLLKKGSATITASAENIKGNIQVKVVENPVVNVSLSSNYEKAKTGDVFHFTATAMDKNGKEIKNAPFTYSFVGKSYDVSSSPSAMIMNDGRFVINEAGVYTVTASCGAISVSKTVSGEERNVNRKIELVGKGSVNDKHTSDFWIWEGVDGKDYAVTGTWGADGTAYFWDVTNPANIIKIDSVQVDARTVNDVKISEDGKLCIISREGASNRKNGIVLIDVTNPRDVSIISTFTENLTGGVHNLFIYENHVYALSGGQKYYVINIEDPKTPKIVGKFELDTPGHSIHDVWVHDGIAYSSNWSDGVQLVDVGNGIAGGSPSNPVQFASYAYPSGWNHAAFPYVDKKTGKFYVIAGDEAFPYGLNPDGRSGFRAAGFIHVIDFTDLENPEEIAWFKVPFGGSHNFWIEDDIMYVAFYNEGVRVVDLSGELMGDMHAQGREIAWIVPEDPDGYVPNAPFTWGAQPHKGHIFYSDWNSGLWAAKLEPVKPEETSVETR